MTPNQGHGKRSSGNRIPQARNLILVVSRSSTPYAEISGEIRPLFNVKMYHGEVHPDNLVLENDTVGQFDITFYRNLAASITRRNNVELHVANVPDIKRAAYNMWKYFAIMGYRNVKFVVQQQ